MGYALFSWPPGRRGLLILRPHPVPKQAKLTEAASVRVPSMNSAAASPISSSPGRTAERPECGRQHQPARRPF